MQLVWNTKIMAGRCSFMQGIAIVGIFFGLQAVFGFPLFKSFESDSGVMQEL